MNIKSYYDQCMSDCKESMNPERWLDKEYYAQWLAQTYFFVRHSTRLLALSAGSMSLDDPLSHVRMCKHIAEESGHEQMALQDLKNIHKNIDDYREFPETAALYQTQYYLIDNVSPYALLGYILVLEGLAVEFCGDIYNTVEKQYGEKSGVFLKVHAEEDQDHIVKAFKQVDLLSSEDQQHVINSMHQATEMYKHMLYCCDKANSHKNTTAA